MKAKDFETLVVVPWMMFLVWTALGCAILPFGLSLGGLGRIYDLAWIALAGVSAYGLLVLAEGLDRARWIAVLALLGSIVAFTVGAMTGLPFGEFKFTLALKAGKYQMALPWLGFLWLALLAGARHLVLLVTAAWSWNRWLHAGLIALVMLLTSVNFQPVAWKVRQYWIWYPTRTELPVPDWPPIQNFASWFALAFLLAAAFPAPRGGFAHPRAPWMLAALVVAINLVLLLTNLAGLLGWRY
jgi:uncharacterized membrane protein